ncbi:MAG: LPS-assembly protein LptD [Nitrospirae bacterium]|nr:LPS-assembly protein LptD [Nitrospirota bacterium]
MRYTDCKRQNEYSSYFFRLFALSWLLLSIFCLPVFAENATSIDADEIEYLSETNIYIARGSVKIIRNATTLNADEIQFNNTTSDAVATGNVIYEDPELDIKADKLELNLNTKLGTIYNSKMFYKSRNYHISGRTIKRLGENTYFIDDSEITSCDAVPPEWYFRGKDVKISREENIRIKHATFFLKGIPLLYSPYVVMPYMQDRKTGLLIPNFGYGNKNGLIFKQGFFWAIRQDMDATFYADYFANRGIGKGINYRYIADPETYGELWMYHIKDSILRRDFIEFKSYQNQKLPHDMTAYLKVHFVNKFDYYDVLETTSSKRIGMSIARSEPFGFASEERVQKYLESNLHITKPLSDPDGRIYLLGQYRESLEGSSAAIPQSLPEAGLIFNTINFGRASFNFSSAATNFWKKDGQQGQRLDINPNFYLSLGRTINFTQKIGLRETLYFLKDPAQNTNRNLFESTSELTTRLLKRYNSFIHFVEPKIAYTYIPSSNQAGLPNFDSADSIIRTSDLIYSLTNRFISYRPGIFESKARLSQRYNLIGHDKPFSPVQMEASLAVRNLSLSANALYNVYSKRITETIDSATFSGHKGFIGVGKNFRLSTSLDQYSLEGGLNKPIKILGRALPIDVSAKIWYDVNGHGVQELNVRSTYSGQCFGLTVMYTRKPYEYQVMFGIELKGFGSVRIG